MGKNLLVLCTGNSCRSQIAHGYLEYYLQEKRIQIYSAGIETHGVNPRAISIMKEDGIDISHYTSNHVDEYSDISFDYILTVCDHANERCPIFPSTARRIHCSFPDPARAIGTEDEILSEFRRIRDLVKTYCKELSATIP